MDSKIIAAIIITLGFIAGVYIYTQNTELNLCTNAEMQLFEISRGFATKRCMDKIHSS